MCHGRWRHWQFTAPTFLSCFIFFCLFSISGAVPPLVFPSCRHAAMCQASSIKLCPLPQPRFFLISSRCPICSCVYFSLFFYFSSLNFFLFSYWRRDIYLGLEEWCWSSCSLHRLPVVTSLADDSQVTDQNIWRGTSGVHSMSPNWSRSEVNQNSSKVQYCYFLRHIFLSLRCSLFFSYFLPTPSAPLFLFFLCPCLCNEWLVCCLPT